MNIKRYYLPLIFLLLPFSSSLLGQSIGMGTDTPSQNAILDIEANNKGFLMPRHATSASNRSHSVAEEEGMLFYDLTGNNVLMYDGGDWEVQGFFPVGSICMWRGTTFPAGWVLCDGTNGTPDLRGRFVVGYHPGVTDYNSIGKTGGQDAVSLQVGHLPAHSHGISDAGHTHSASATHGHKYTVDEYSSRTLGSSAVSGGGSPAYSQEGNTTSETFSGVVSIGVATLGSTEVGYAGGSAPIDNRPPYYVLAYIMKIN